MFWNVALVCLVAGIALVLAARFALKRPKKGLARSLGYISLTAAAVLALLAILSNPPG